MDEVTFTKYVTEGKIASVTISVRCGKIGVVTLDTAVLGDRVTQGPAWPEKNDAVKYKIPSGKVGTIDCISDSYGFYVRWDAHNGDTLTYGTGLLRYTGECTGGPTVVTAYFVGNGETSTFELLGDANHRLAKLTPWLESKGFKKNGPDVISNKETHSTKTVTFSKASVPF